MSRPRKLLILTSPFVHSLGSGNMSVEDLGASRPVRHVASPTTSRNAWAGHRPRVGWSTPQPGHLRHGELRHNLFALRDHRTEGSLLRDSPGRYSRPDAPCAREDYGGQALRPNEPLAI